MGRLASGGGLQPRQQIPGDRDARAGAAWLAARRQQAYAHDRLSRPRPFDRVERGRQGACDLGRRRRDHVAVRQQGWADGQGARDVGAAKSARHGVACHPDQAILVAGYEDGTVLMVRMADGAEILVHRNGGAAIAALAWNASGTLLAFAAEDGEAGLLEL